MAYPTFTVDESIEPRDAEKALEELRRMAKYGRMADRALRSIREKGFYDGFAPLAGLPGSSYSGQYAQGKKKSDVRFARLPARRAVSREDLGPMGELRLELDKVRDTKYAGNDCKEVSLWLRGPMAVQVANGLPEYEIRESRRQLGSVRVNKGHLSWLENSAYGSGAAWRVYKEMKYAGARESLAAFSRGVSCILTVLESKDLMFSAKTLELQATAWGLFLADGHAERLFRDIHGLIVAAIVMES